MENTKRKLFLRSGGIILILVIISLCLFPILYYFIAPELDIYQCVREFDKRMNIRDGSGTEDDIRGYIKRFISTSIKEGMSQQEVIEALKKISPLEVRNISPFTDHVILKICRHPLNSFLLIADYKINGKLKTIFLESNIVDE